MAPTYCAPSLSSRPQSPTPSLSPITLHNLRTNLTAISEDWTHIVTATGPNPTTLHIYSTKSYTHPQNITVPRLHGPPTCIDINTSRSLIAVGFQTGGLVQLWDINGKGLRYSLSYKSNTTPVMQVMIRDEGVFALFENGHLRGWSIRGDKIGTMKCFPEKSIVDVRNGRVTVASRKLGEVSVGKWTTGVTDWKPIWTADFEKFPINFLSLSFAGGYVLVAMGSRVVVLKDRDLDYREKMSRWGRIQWEDFSSSGGRNIPFRSALLTPDGQRAIVSNEDMIKVVDVERKKTLFQTELKVQKIISSTSDLSRVALLETHPTTFSPRIVIRNLLTCVEEISFENAKNSEREFQNVCSCLLNNNGTCLITTQNKRIIAWDLVAKTTRILTGHPGKIMSSAISPTKHYLVTACSKKVIKVWNIQTLDCLCTFECAHTSDIFSVGIDDTGKTVVIGCRDGTAQIWNTEPPSLRFTFGSASDGSHEGGIFSITFGTTPQKAYLTSRHTHCQWIDVTTGKSGPGGYTSIGYEPGCVKVLPDGRFYISANGKTVKVWNGMAQMWASKSFKGHQDKVFNLAVSRDGRKVVSGSYDGSARVWDLKGKSEGGFRLEGG
ncbi:hypothetical protein HK097_010815, partial [Rhizophlyctis rosea]